MIEDGVVCAVGHARLSERLLVFRHLVESSYLSCHISHGDSRAWKSRLPIEHIHTFLVHAGRISGEVPQINGAKVELKGKIFGLMDGIYAHSDTECDIEIAFNASEDGEQTILAGI